jgi:FMN reductase
VTLVDPPAGELAFPGEQPASGSTAGRDAMQAAVRAATGVSIATPEYHGSMAAKLKLMFENMGFPSAMAGKPVALLGVASGVIGAIKALEQVRSICAHVGAIALPSPVSIAGVNKVFDEAGNCTDPKLAQRLRGLAGSLMDYIHTTVCPRITLEQMVREG